MRYSALATDYDGTIAHDGVVDDATVDALGRARSGGIRLIMVTGRELDDLYKTFAHCDLFERIVAENGALLHEPANGTTRPLAPPPPPALISRLSAQGVPLSVGRTIVATVEPHEHAVLEAIHQLGLEWHIIFNKGSVMALPSSVNKATGLKAALAELNLPPTQVVGIGDAENDQAFLRMCGLGAAVANALPAVKARADIVTAGARGAGVAELIDRMLSTNLAEVTPRQELHAPGSGAS